MELTCAVGAMTLYPASAMMSIAGKAGFDAVELLLTPVMLRRGSGYYSSLAAHYGVGISSVHARLHFRNVSANEKIASDCASVRFASQVEDCQAIVLHPPVTRTGELTPVWRWLDAVCSERERARPQLHLALENRPDNHDGTSRQQIDNLERLRFIASEWGVGITLDIAHAASFGIDPLVAIDAVAARLVNVHISDVRDVRYRGGLLNGLFRDHRVPGEGVLEISDILDRLLQHEYDGLLTVELSPLSLRAFWPWSPARVLSDTRLRLLGQGIDGVQDSSTGATSQRQIRR